MNSYKTSSELKSLARGQLFGKYSTAISAMLIPAALTFITTLLLNLLIPSLSITGFIIYYIAALLVQIILAIFNTGTAKLYLNMVCKRPFAISDMFYGFREQANKSLIVILYTAGLSILCCIPAVIAIWVYAKTNALYMIPVITIALIFAIVATCIISLTYSQCFYLLVDLPRYSAWEVLKLSAKLMTGNKGRLFYLQVSFLGLYLLGICSCYIGMLWVMPYVNATNTFFYLDLTARKA